VFSPLLPLGHRNYYSRTGCSIDPFGSSYTFLCFFLIFSVACLLMFLFGTVLQCLMIRCSNSNPITLQHPELLALLFCSNCCQTRMFDHNNQLATNCCHCCCAAVVMV